MATSAIFLSEEFPHRRAIPFPFFLREEKNDENYTRSVFFSISPSIFLLRDEKIDVFQEQGGCQMCLRALDIENYILAFTINWNIVFRLKFI